MGDRWRLVTLKGQTRDPNTLRAQYLENSWGCYLATIANYYLVCCEAVRSAIIATAWLLVFTTKCYAYYLWVVTYFIPKFSPEWGMGCWKSGFRRTKALISLKRGKIGPRLLLRTNRKSYTRFRLVPKSMTLDDLEGSLCTLFQNTCVFRSALWKFKWR